MWVNKERPDQEMIEHAFDQNDDGGGCAWRTTNDQGEAVVEWKKGLNVADMIRLAEELPVPYILHFRIASIGGIRPTLTHPFPINKNGSLALEGQTKGYVLFHNGHWKEWSDECKRAAILSNTPIPMGRWSDTRAMAWLCAIYGPGFMELMPEQKGIVFGPTDMHIFDGNGWSKVNDVWCSNDFFTKVQTIGGQKTPGHAYPYSTTLGPGRGVDGKFCRYVVGQDVCVNQTLDGDGYCFMHPKGVSRMGTTPVTGGSRVPPSPFVSAPQREVQRPIELPPGEIVSIELAERLHHENQLSGKRLKKIRGLWEVATSSHTKAAKRAQHALQQISIAMLLENQVSSGSAH